MRPAAPPVAHSLTPAVAATAPCRERRLRPAAATALAQAAAGGGRGCYPPPAGSWACSISQERRSAARSPPPPPPPPRSPPARPPPRVTQDTGAAWPEGRRQPGPPPSLCRGSRGERRVGKREFLLAPLPLGSGGRRRPRPGRAPPAGCCWRRRCSRRSRPGFEASLPAELPGILGTRASFEARLHA